MGYSEQWKAYKLYNSITKRTIISTDVKFLEDEKWVWNENLQQQQQFEMKYFDEDQAPNNGSSSHSTTSTPQSASRSQSTPKYHSSNSSSSNGSPVKTRSLHEIYEVTHGNDDDG